MKGLEKYSTCSECSYKNRFEKMKDIMREKEEQNNGRQEIRNDSEN